MDKQLQATLVFIYQCLSGTGDGYQIIGLTVYNAYDDGSLDSINYSMREPVTDLTKLGNLKYFGSQFNLNLRLKEVNGDVEVFMTEEDTANLGDNAGTFNLVTSRDKIAKDPEEIMRCLPDTEMIKTYVGGVKEIISSWCVDKASEQALSMYKDIDRMIAKGFAEEKGIDYVELYPEEVTEDDELKDKRRQEELEKYADYPVEMELFLNATVVQGMPALNKINAFSGEETLRNLREYTAKCKVCSVKYFGDDLKYVVDGDICTAESQVIVNYNGVEIAYTDLDKLREISRENSELERKLVELEAEEEKRLNEEKERIERERLEKERVEQERLAEEQSQIGVEVQPEEVESLPMDIGLSSEVVEKELEEWNNSQKELLSKYTLVSNSYGNPDSWEKEFSDYRKELDELDDESDHIVVMCKSSYSENPIIVGLLKRVKVQLPKSDDDEDDDSNFEYKIEFYDEFELLSTGTSTLSNLGINTKLELLVVPSKFTFKYPVTPLLEICANAKDIPENLAVLFINEKRDRITKELVAERLGHPELYNTSLGEFKSEDLELFEYDSICNFTENLCRATALEERLNLRVFHFSEPIINELDDNYQFDSIIEEYNEQQKFEYFDFNNAVHRGDGKIYPISANYILPQMLEDEVYFSLVKSYSETQYLKVTSDSQYVKAKVPNLKNLISGVSSNYTYFNSSNYGENFGVEREYYKAKGKAKEEIDEIISDHILATVGSVANSKEPIQDYEEPFLKYLKNLIDCELIREYELQTKSQLKELVKNGAEAKYIDEVLIEWCRGAYALNYMHTNYVADEEIILSLGYDREGIAPANYCDYHVIKVGSERNMSLKTDWNVSTRTSDTSKKINGFYPLRRYVELNKNTYIWAEVLVRLLRWGSKKQKFLLLNNSDLVYDFSQARIVEKYEDTKIKSMTDTPLTLNQILAGRYCVESLNIKDLGKEFKKYMVGTVVGSRQQNFKNVFASLMISLGRNDEDNWEQVFIDTLSFVKSLYNNEGKVEVKGIDGEWSLNTCEGITYDSQKGRISIDMDLCGVFDEQTNTTSPNVQVRNEQTIGKSIKEYELANKRAKETYLGATDNVIISDIPVDDSYIIHKMQIRTLDKECLADATEVVSSNANVDVEEIQLPFEVFTKFCAAEDFIAKTGRAVKAMARKWAMPYIIADYLYSKCVGDYLNNRYEQPVSGDRRAFNLEIYWNCVLFGYNVCFNNLSMDEGQFLQNVMLKNGVLTWSEANLQQTVMFQDDAVSSRLKNLIESTIKAGGQISPVVKFEANFSGDTNRFANHQLLCLKGKNDFYFVFIEGEYSNVILHEKNGQVPVLSLKNPKQASFFKKLSGAGKIGYSSPELKKAVEDTL